MNIKKLIKKYNDNRDYYLSTKYNETQLRTDFLDPFFELLGWDIKNSAGKSTNTREVLLEEGLKENATSNTKKPDYTFRLFSERKFFLEAKKPSIKIDRSDSSARQVRRYGFTAKLKISVLSDFEYLAIYDCSTEVKEDDSVEYARVKLYHYSEYEEAFDEIQSLLAYETVYSGAFDEVWNDIEEQLKLSSIDTLFLAQINEWRTILGKEIYSHNSTINIVELNDTVQSYINSIIFLRVCEDRNLETYETLLSFANDENHNALIQKFQEADRKYNAGLFNHSLINEIISNNGSAFWLIIKQLYFPHSSYSFTVFSSDILGRIYEIFLGEQLQIVDDEIVLTKKPEHIDRDIVTTPTFIIQDILHKTISEYCLDKSDIEILDSTFADIACGSGAFLLEIYQLLHDTLVDYYFIHDRSKIIKISPNSFKLNFNIKKLILENCIYGVDKDYNAVEASKFGLLLKLLENEDNTTISTPALPNLDNNIQFGNSLISSDKTDDINIEKINPFDFANTKFDVIVGNPPYMSTEDMKKFTPLEKPIYTKNYISAYKQYDKYFLFIEQGLHLLNDNGYLGYIIPNKFIQTNSAEKLRHLLKDGRYIHKLISFGSNQLFPNKTTYTSLLFLRNNNIQNSFKFLLVDNLKKWKIKHYQTKDYEDVTFQELGKIWMFVPKKLKGIFNKIISQSIQLDKIGYVSNGIQTSANKIYIHKSINEDNDYLYFIKDGKNWKIEKELTRPYLETVKNKKDSLNTYCFVEPNSFLIYPYKKTVDAIEPISIFELEEDYPYAFQYFVNYKSKLLTRRMDVNPNHSTLWHRYGRNQNLEKCDVPIKIVVGVLSKANKYALDYKKTFVSSGGTAGYTIITLDDNSEYSIYYIQALLNSKYLEWFASIISGVFRGGYIPRGTYPMPYFPIHIIDFKNNDEKLLHDNIVTIQKKLIDIQSKIDENIGNKRESTPLKRQFSVNKLELDNLLKVLFDLKDDDNLIPNISEIYATN